MECPRSPLFCVYLQRVPKAESETEDEVIVPEDEVIVPEEKGSKLPSAEYFTWSSTGSDCATASDDDDTSKYYDYTSFGEATTESETTEDDNDVEDKEIVR